MQFLPLCQGRISRGVYTVWDRNLSSPAAAVCPWCLQAVTQCWSLLPSKGTQPQHLPLPRWRNPPSSSGLHCSGHAHTAPGLHHTALYEFLLRPVIKGLQQWGLNNSKCSLGWCFLFFRWFLLTPFLATGQNLSPWPAHHRHNKEELFLKPLSQPSLSPSFPRPWVSKPPLAFPDNNSQSKNLHLMWALPAHPSQADGFLHSLSQLLFSPVYYPLFGLFCRALGSQLAPCLRTIFPQFRLLILFPSSKCKIWISCVGFFVVVFFSC